MPTAVDAKATINGKSKVFAWESADCAGKAVVNGIETSESLGDAFALADLKRLEGRLFLTRGRNDDARRAFEAAIEIGQRQDAGLYMLRVD